jgi:hypothetical protein
MSERDHIGTRQFIENRVASLRDELVGLICGEGIKTRAVLSRAIQAAEGEEMAELDNLKAAVAANSTAMANLATEIDAGVAKLVALATAVPIDPVAVQAASDAISATTATMTAEAQKLADTLNPPTPPPPHLPRRRRPSRRIEIARGSAAR